MSTHAIVVGAGLAGLLSANHLVDVGHAVTVLDGAGHAGGRAHTTTHVTPAGPAHMNLGPHAVYLGGHLAGACRELGVSLPGRMPNPATARVRRDDVIGGAAGPMVRALPTLVRLLSTPPDPAWTVTTWLDRRGVDGEARSVLLALVRTTTYAQAPDRLAAGTAYHQLRLATRGVRYLHGGWASLVGRLRARVEHRGGRVLTGTAVAAVTVDHGTATGVRLSSGEHVPSDGVVVAVGGPRDVARLLPSTLAEHLHHDAVPIRMATLDVVLSGPGRPAQVLGDGDDPHYLLAQSRYADDLAPADHEIVHVARYLGPGQRGGAATRVDLETLLGQVRPGWSDRVVDVRFLPNLTVAHVLPEPEARSHAVTVPGVARLALAGDAFGAPAHLADAVAVSARAAAEQVTPARRRRPAAA